MTITVFEGEGEGEGASEKCWNVFQIILHERILPECYLGVHNISIPRILTILWKCQLQDLSPSRIPGNSGYDPNVCHVEEEITILICVCTDHHKLRPSTEDNNSESDDSRGGGEGGGV